MDIQAVVFDMDGVIFDTEPLLTRFWCQAANDFGFPMTTEQALKLRSLAKRYAEPMLKEWFGDSFNYRKVRARRIDLMEDYIEENGLKTKPYLDILLDYLDRNGYKKAIATSTDFDRATTYLQSSGLEKRFDAICCGPCVEHGKPKPDIYIYTAERLGLKPKQCLAIEDSPNGIISAHDAGAYTVMIPDLTPPTKELWKLIYRKCSDLLGVIGVLETAPFEVYDW